MPDVYNAKADAETFLRDYFGHQKIRYQLENLVRVSGIAPSRVRSSRTLRKVMMENLHQVFRQRESVRQRLMLGPDFRSIIPLTSCDDDTAAWFDGLPDGSSQRESFNRFLKKLTCALRWFGDHWPHLQGAAKTRADKSLEKLKLLMSSDNEAGRAFQQLSHISDAFGEGSIDRYAHMRAIPRSCNRATQKVLFRALFSGSFGKVTREGSWRAEILKVVSFWADSLRPEVSGVTDSLADLWARSADTGAAKKGEFEIVISANPFDLFYMSAKCSWDTSSCFRWDGQMRTAPRALAQEPATCVAFLIKAGTTFPYEKEGRVIIHAPDYTAESRTVLTQDYSGFPRFFLGRPYGNVSSSFVDRLTEELQSRLIQSSKGRIQPENGSWLSKNHRRDGSDAQFNRYSGNSNQVYYDKAISGASVFVPKVSGFREVDYLKFPMLYTRSATCLGCGAGCPDSQGDEHGRNYFCETCLAAVSKEKSFALASVHSATKTCSGCLKSKPYSSMVDLAGLPLCPECVKSSEHCSSCLAPISKVLARTKKSQCPVCDKSNPTCITYAEAQQAGGREDFYLIPLGDGIGPAPSAEP